MIKSMRLAAITTAVMFGLGAFGATAAPTAVGDPTAKGSSAVTKAKMGSEMKSTIEQRITDLHAKLLITPAQQPQWDAFAQVMRDNAQGMNHTFEQRVTTLPSMTAPENMQSYAQVAMDHAQGMQKLVPAFQAVYDTMSDSQKKTADMVFRADAHHGKGARHG